MSPAWFLPIGFFVGTYGTIIGAGGGFIILALGGPARLAKRTEEEPGTSATPVTA